MSDREVMREPRPKGPDAIPNIVMKGLLDYGDLCVARINREIIVPGPYAAEHVLFFVGPKRPISSIDELNELMQNIFKEISPDRTMNAFIEAGHLSIGHLSFSEGIFIRETDVYVYPDQDLAEKMFELRKEIEGTPLESEDEIGKYQEYSSLVNQTTQIPLEKLSGFKIDNPR